MVLNPTSTFMTCVSISVFFRGVNLCDSKKRWKRYTLYLLQVLFLCCNLYNFVGSITSSWETGNVVKNSSSLIFLVSRTTATLFLLFKARKVRELSRSLFHSISMKMKRKTNIFALTILSFFLLTCLPKFIMNTILLKPPTLVEPIIMPLLCIIWTTFAKVVVYPLSDFVSSTVLLYLVIFNLLYNHVDDLLWRSKINIKTVDSALANMKKFDDTFSLLPLLWLTTNFVRASRYVQLWNSYLGNFGFKTVIYSYPFMIDNIVVVMALCYISRRQDQMSENVAVLLNQISLLEIKSLSSLSQQIRLSSLLVEIGSFKVTAWSLFPLERSLILSFMSVVLNFTVLFYQLAHWMMNRCHLLYMYFTIRKTLPSLADHSFRANVFSDFNKNSINILVHGRYQLLSSLVYFRTLATTQ